MNRSRTGRRLVLPVLLSLIWVAACSTPSSTATRCPVAPPTVRVMSYNIRYPAGGDRPSWEDRRGPLARQVAFTDPDVIGLQEAQPDPVAYLAAQWPDYDRYGIGRDDGVHGETTTVFWRRDRFATVGTQTQWCSPTPDRPSIGWDAQLPRTVTRVILRDRVSGRLLDVRNTHLDHVGVTARANCAQQIASIAPAEDALVVVMGDMNSGRDDPPYRILTGDQLGLKDARVGAAIDFGPAGTVNDFDVASTGGEQVDRIFVPRDVPITRFGVLTDSVGGKVISDHFPIVADLTVTPG